LSISRGQSMHVLLVTSPRVMWSLYEMPNMKPRHCRWNTCSFFYIF